MLKTVRSQFLEFFKKKGHMILDSASLLPENDRSLLFVNSGMAPLKAYFLNEKQPPSKRIANAQRCLRVGGKHNDLSEIGYTKRHHTFFEMLGNFSFGDYFKKEAIEFAWEFLVDVIKLDKSKLYITIHPDDVEAEEYWLSKISKDHLTKLKANIWTMGDCGPWGYCSEIFYDLDEGEGDFENGDRYLEIWNLVFTQFCFDGQKNFTLDFPCIDTGIGLERLVSVLEGKKDNYDIQFFMQVLPFLNMQKQTPHTKIFLDHLRSTASLIMEGVKPGPSQEGYVLRRLIRRMLRSFSYFENVDFSRVVGDIFQKWRDVYVFDLDLILPIYLKEKKSFENTINSGLSRFDEVFNETLHISAQDIFLLHDTYGLTVDIVLDLVRERNGTGDFDGFELLMEEARKKAAKEKLVFDYPETNFVEQDQCKANVIGIEDDLLFLDSTVFYGEGGGQIGDTGVVFNDQFKAKIIDTIKSNKVYAHKFEIQSGEIKVGDSLQLKIDTNRRRRIEAHHSCSHLLQYALEKIYGDGIKQMGSFVSEKKFREDFSFPSDTVDLQKIEDLINEMISQDKQTVIRYMELNEARNMGAKAFFEYDDKVRVVQVGDSLELCGGTHVSNTKDMIGCRLLKVSAVKSGVKRFEGVAGLAYVDYLKEKADLFDEACDILSSNQEGFLNALKKACAEKVEPALKLSKNVGSVNIGIVIADESDAIEDLMDKFKLDICGLYVEKDSKANFKVQSKIASYSAKDCVKEVSSLFEAKGGGGNPERAQTGGKKISDFKILFDKMLSLF